MRSFADPVDSFRACGDVPADFLLKNRSPDSRYCPGCDCVYKDVYKRQEQFRDLYSTAEALEQKNPVMQIGKDEVRLGDITVMNLSGAETLVSDSQTCLLYTSWIRGFR